MIDPTETRVLVVDDEPAVRLSLRSFLEDCGYHVLEAENGRTGLELFKRKRPELVLIDLRLPEVDGLEVLATLRDCAPETPVIVVSGAGVIGDVVEALRLGAWNYLIKPIEDLSILRHAVEQALERARLLHDKRQYQAHLEREVANRTEELQRTNAELRASEEKYRLIFESLQDVYWEVLWEDGTVAEISPSVESVLRYPRKEVLQASVAKLYADPEEAIQLIERLRAGGKVMDYEISLRDKEGTIKLCSITAQLHLDPHGAPTKICGMLRDISERKRAEAQIEHQAYHDALTDLPNRSLLLDRLGQALAQARRHNCLGAVLFLDLDHFKTINDSLGHSVGDALLKEVAARLSQCLRQTDTAARLGGDEFVVLLSELGDDSETAARSAQGVAEKIRSALSSRYMLGEYEHYVTPSIGIALFPVDEVTCDDVLKHADTAMYRAKGDGRNAIRFYLPSMQDVADKRLMLEKDLRNALARGEMCLYFQPQMDASNRIVGVEALLRWQHPVRGLVLPGEFIPVAEETGLILPLGDWVVQQACRHFKAWRDDGCLESPQYFAVNVSPRQFHQPDFAKQIERILVQTDTDPSCLVLELTEWIMLDNVPDTIAKMQALRKLGVRFAIDDFGTGYSSLMRLKRLPLDTLKIDKSFIQDLPGDPSDAAIVDTIIAMAHHLELEVVAEGVETDTELAFLRTNGCHLYQGCYFSRPLPAEAFAQLLIR